MRKLFASRSLFLIMQCLVAAAWPERVQAYCQATTVQASLVCPSSCVFEGKPVAWATREIEYAFNKRGFPGLEDSAVRAAIASAFAAWEGVTCDERPLGFRFAELVQTTDLAVGPLESEPNLNVISLLNAPEWQQSGFAATEFART
ncbi:MAG: hypothetical protein JWN04_2310, partial [Myxococcaceae bacterium]|nr:hypothetical protein [Myxococcaceae bacterium]